MFPAATVKAGHIYERRAMEKVLEIEGEHVHMQICCYDTVEVV